MKKQIHRRVDETIFQEVVFYSGIFPYGSIFNVLVLAGLPFLTGSYHHWLSPCPQHWWSKNYRCRRREKKAVQNGRVGLACDWYSTTVELEVRLGVPTVVLRQHRGNQQKTGVYKRFCGLWILTTSFEPDEFQVKSPNRPCNVVLGGGRKTLSEVCFVLIQQRTEEFTTRNRIILVLDAQVSASVVLLLSLMGCCWQLPRVLRTICLNLHQWYGRVQQKDYLVKMMSEQKAALSQKFLCYVAGFGLVVVKHFFFHQKDCLLNWPIFFGQQIITCQIVRKKQWRELTTSPFPPIFFFQVFQFGRRSRVILLRCSFGVPVG